MTFSKEQFFKYIKNETVSKDSCLKLYRLYKIYNMISLALKKNGKEVIERLEDSIYTIDGVVLSEKEKLVLELSNITDTLNNVVDEKLKNQVDLELSKLKFELEELDLSDKSVILYFKKNISLLQSELGIENTFLMAASESFLELYRNMCIKDLPKNNYGLVKNSVYNSIEIEKKFVNESLSKDESLLINKR